MMYHKDVFVERVGKTQMFFSFADIAVNQVSENTFCGFEKCHRGQKLLYKKIGDNLLKNCDFRGQIENDRNFSFCCSSSIRNVAVL